MASTAHRTWTPDGEHDVLTSAAATRIRELEAEVERLHTRLEDNFAYEAGVNDGWHKVKVEPGSIPDGIACRDATIRSFEDRLSAAEARCRKLEEALREIAAACEADCMAPGITDDAPDDEPVGASSDSSMFLTFGMIRRARALLDQADGEKSDADQG